MNRTCDELPVCDGAIFNANVRNCPAAELAKYAGQYVAWSLDGTRILANGNDPEQLDRNMAAAGLQHGQVVEDYVPAPEESTLLL
jgi:hypothetical protein